MTRRAYLRVLALKGGRIESGTMGVEPPAAESRMAGETVALGVAGNTAFQVLAGSLAVTQQEELFGVMVAAAERGPRRHAGLHVTVGAKLPGIMAIAATRFAGVGRGRMA